MNKTALIRDLLQVSRHYGGNPAFVLAGGGNTSVKDGAHLYVKASGIALSNITEQGFAKLNLQKLLSLYSVRYPKGSKARESQVLNNLLAAREPGEEAKRPSVETLLHAIIPGRFVVHTHPALVNALTCSRKGQTVAARLFGSKAMWVPYTDPGFTLACKVKNCLEEFTRTGKKTPAIILLQNHGLIISGNSVAEVKKNTHYVMTAIKRLIRRSPDFSPTATDLNRAALLAPVIRMACMGSGNTAIATFDCSSEVLRRIASKTAFKPLAAPFTPDHIVYCQAAPLFVSTRRNLDDQRKEVLESIRRFQRLHGTAPKIIAIEKLGVFSCGQGKLQTETALQLFHDSLSIAAYAESFGGSSSMKPGSIRFISKWEAETYRRQIAFTKGAPEKMAEKIAIVTGGAQGFGKGLAEALLRQGAQVVIADRNLPLARETARSLNKAFGCNRAISLAVDVADETSVCQLMWDTALQLGGLDLLVSNAGVLKAGSLDALSTADFELVTRVNYQGFYLCAKHASEIMKAQHKYAPGYFMDIVQINSKSGLSGSKNNFAYAGGKFGGIGLAQSFALELVDFNIKVNAICPGNLFDGPLWSDPKNGLFVQYLKARKVPGARTIEDVRCFYEAKVPMKRGCTVEDVARALLYSIEQNYETGQAIPVTGGQNMLN